ncbi:hypothetical protein LINPERHAP1_LOCUS39003 [Linum perenne]
MSMLLFKSRGGDGAGVWQFETMTEACIHIGQVGCVEFWRFEKEKCWHYWMH